MHLESQGTRTAEALETLTALGYSKGTWTLGHSGTRRALGHSRHLGTWPLWHLGTGALKRHLGTWALRYSVTWPLELLEALH